MALPSYPMFLICIVILDKVCVYWILLRQPHFVFTETQNKINPQTLRHRTFVLSLNFEARNKRRLKFGESGGLFIIGPVFVKDIEFWG